MLMLISPAKTLDFESPVTIQYCSNLDMLNEAQQLVEIARELSPAELSGLMNISDKLAGLNAARFAQWTTKIDSNNGRQALLAFKGDVYTGLDAASLDSDGFAYAQQHLRILSGLYGILRPLDLILPYRLEMGTRLKNARGKDLYAFWQGLITEKVNQALLAQQDDLIINLASNEYYKSLQPAELKGRVITPVFKDLKNGQYKIISFYAKKARGMMVRHLIDERAESIEQLKAFERDGYYYSEALSKPDMPMFLRDH